MGLYGTSFLPADWPRPIRHECWLWVRTSGVIVSDVADLQHRTGHVLDLENIGARHVRL